MTALWAGWYGGSMPVSSKTFFSLPKLPDWGPPSFLFHVYHIVGYLRVCGGVDRGLKFTINIHVGRSLRMGGAIPLLYIINVTECDITTSVFIHIHVVSMLPAEDIAPCIMFQDFICEERIF